MANTRAIDARSRREGRGGQASGQSGSSRGHPAPPNLKTIKHAARPDDPWVNEPPRASSRASPARHTVEHDARPRISTGVRAARCPATLHARPARPPHIAMSPAPAYPPAARTAAGAPAPISAQPAPAPAMSLSAEADASRASRLRGGCIPLPVRPCVCSWRAERY
jgi:hypothetical protein